jgi:hypothetical protein
VRKVGSVAVVEVKGGKNVEAGEGHLSFGVCAMQCVHYFVKGPIARDKCESDHRPSANGWGETVYV